MDLSFDSLFHIVEDEVIGPLFNALGVDVLQLIEQIIVKVKCVADWQPVNEEVEGL